MKILRLSIFNIRKHKKEAFSIVLLAAICMAMLGIALINMKKGSVIYDRMFEQTEGAENVMLIYDKDFRNEYYEIMQEDTRLENLSKVNVLWNSLTYYKSKNGEELGFQVIMVTESDEKKLEKFEPETTLSDEEISSLEHSIYMPYYVNIDMGYEVGETFTLVINGREYPFQIAGFYETGLFADAGFGFKCVVTEQDYMLLNNVITHQNVMISYDVKEEEAAHIDEINKDLKQKFSDYSGKDVEKVIRGWSKTNAKDNSVSTVNDILGCLAIISVITAIASLYMIRHRITNDIDNQMESIGVLEALGYRSKEISLAYIYEYVLLGVTGTLVGAIIALVSDPFMTHIIQVIIGHKGGSYIDLKLLIIPMLALILLVLVSALSKAWTIKKYPPLVAFRRGIATHHFGKNHLSLEKSRGDINTRLGLKSLLQNTRQNIGIMLVVLFSSVAIAFCVLVMDLFRDGGNAFMSVVGFTSSDIIAYLDKGVDSYEFASELEAMDEVRKCVPGSSLAYNVKIKEQTVENVSDQVTVYDDYSETEGLPLIKGRYPEHDNEVMITQSSAKNFGFELGDSITLVNDSVEKGYIITGYTTSINNSGLMVYLTTSGFKRVEPTATLQCIDIYLEEDVDEDAFVEKISDMYGSSISDTAAAEISGESYEEKIKAKADEQMALLKSKYGVSGVSYAIKMGDKMITGDSRSFRISQITQIDKMLATTFGGISRISQLFSVVFALVVAVVVAVIINMLTESTVRKERRSLGIKKACGYTSKDLRKQIAIRFIPVASVGVIIGSILGIPIIKFFETAIFGALVNLHFVLIPVLMVLLIAYIYIVTYISAGKVKKISVTELMTE